MRYYLVFLVSIVFPLLCQSQGIEWSNQQRVKSKANYAQIVGQNASGIFLIRSRNADFSRDVYLEKYKANLSSDNDKPIWQPSGSVIEKVSMHEGGLNLIARQKSAGIYELLTWQIDNNMNVFTQPLVILQEPSLTMDEKNGFIIKYSPDKHHYFVLFASKSADKKSSYINIALFNEQNQNVYKKQFPLNLDITEISLSNALLDNDKNIFFLLDYPIQKDNRRKRDERKYMFYAFFDDEKELLEYDLIQEDLVIHDVGITYNQVGQSIHIAGFYRQFEDKNITGTFMLTVDCLTHKVLNMSHEVFSSTFITKANAISLSTASGLSDLYVRQVIPRSDGGTMIVAEKYYESRQSYTYYVNGFPQVSYRIVYNYDEIVFINKKADGTTQQAEVVKKKQSSMNDGGYFSSFITVNTNDRVAFIYNADVSVEGDILITSVSPSGEIETRILVKSLSFYVSLMPFEARQVDYNVLLASTLKDKKYSLMRITF
jgi:hypothetical protein